MRNDWNINLRTALCSEPGWSLFLDRDGVLNRRPRLGYVTKSEEFVWIDGALEAVKVLTGLFDRIIVVTNQQGIGKAIMTEEQLLHLHAHMLDDVKKNRGRIDAAYFASGLRHLDSFNRKPGAGMFAQAKSDFPEIEANKSIMVGDSFSDVLFGYRLNMVTVFISNTKPFPVQYRYMVDHWFNNLLAFSNFMRRISCVL